MDSLDNLEQKVMLAVQTIRQLKEESEKERLELARVQGELEAARRRNAYRDPAAPRVRDTRTLDDLDLRVTSNAEALRRDTSQVRALRLAVGGVVMVDRPSAAELERRLARCRAERGSLDDLRFE